MFVEWPEFFLVLAQQVQAGNQKAKFVDEPEFFSVLAQLGTEANTSFIRIRQVVSEEMR